MENHDIEQPDPDWPDKPDPVSDEVLRCPGCERPNQFGDLCVDCQQHEDEAAYERYITQEKGC